MKDKIKEIAYQVKLLDADGWNTSNLTRDVEKFAELIIRECMRVIEEEQDKLPCDNVYHTGIKNGVWQASEIISEHFGVER
jgi:hypothetical protein